MSQACSMAAQGWRWARFNKPCNTRTPSTPRAWSMASAQRVQGGAFAVGEVGADLPAGGAVQARVGHRPLPVEQEVVLFIEAGERPAFEGVFLDVVDAAFDVALGAGRIRPGGQQGDAVVLSERTHLGVEVGVEPISLGDGGAEVVQHQALRHAAEVPEGVLQAADEVVGRLPRDGFAVALARVTQHNAEDVGAAALAVRQQDGRAAAEIDLGLFAGAAFQPAERQLLGRGQAPDEAANAVVAAAEAVFGRQVLVDALRRQAEVQLGLDGRPPRLAVTGPTRGRLLRVGRGRAGARARAGRADGRNGWF